MTTTTLEKSASRYRWVMLALCTLTPLFVVTLPLMSLPPMFATIGQDLDLSLVQVGVIWGTMAVMGLFFSLIGGSLGDRFGTRISLSLSCLLAGVAGASRSFAVDFNTLLLASLVYGIALVVIQVTIFKVIRQWFPTEQLGMASGVVSAGFAGGLMLGPLLSTSLIMPALGGWRQVLLFYGGLGILLGVLWLIVSPAESQSDDGANGQIGLGESLRHVMKMRNLWILGLGGLGINACFGGFTGYLPTYLKAIGWAEMDADRALSAFFITSLSAVIPMSILSDKLRLRRGYLIFASLVLSCGIAALGFVEGALILLVVAATGFVFDTFMAILNASVMEVDGVGFLYAGTALGLTNTIRHLGGALSPPIGNSLAEINLSLPFLFWGAMGLFGMFMFTRLRQTSPTPEIES
jgi:cyanate permease